MYSVLIKNGEKSYVYCTNSDKKYSYHTNTDGTVFSGDSEAAKAKVQELLETYPLGKIVVVHNVNMTADFTLEDVA